MKSETKPNLKIPAIRNSRPNTSDTAEARTKNFCGFGAANGRHGSSQNRG